VQLPPAILASRWHLFMDMDSITPRDMRFNPPTFEAGEIAGQIDADYGLQGQWSSLVGERDQNFRLRGERGQDHVVKIAGQDEDR
jgi:Ser/Thr protein kinase RdoA (MazF antagonist)